MTNIADELVKERTERQAAQMQTSKLFEECINLRYKLLFVENELERAKAQMKKENTND